MTFWIVLLFGVSIFVVCLWVLLFCLMKVASRRDDYE